MKFSRIFFNRLQSNPAADDVVVVIDVLRSFTTAAVALAQGARAVYPVEAISEALTLSAELPWSLTVGAVGGGDPVPGFTYGNSPAALASTNLHGRDVVMTTAAGVKGLQRFRHARALYAASLVCAEATARAIREAGADQVSFIITGEWVDRDGDEDIACADYIEALLRGEKPKAQVFAQRVRDSDFGRRFLAGNNPNLPLADLELACAVDRYDFALPVQHKDGRLLIANPARPVRPH